MRVLYLSEWYPNRYDAMEGLFVRKHAQSVVRQGVDVTVLYLHHDEHIRKEELIEQMTDGVKEVYVYYPHILRYLKAFRHGYQYIKRKWGRPDLCQLNVITKNGLLPLYLWKRFRIPYIIIEHWSGYLPQNRKQSIGTLHLWLTRILTRNARIVLPVSQSLMDSMKQCGLTCSQWQLTPNVVDDFFYQSYPRPKGKPTEIAHVSCFENKSKNIPGLLRAIAQVAKLRSDFHITMIGTGIDFDKDTAYAKELGLDKIVSFTGELTPIEVYHTLQKSQIFVLFSNYENAPVVISESLAMGIPVIATTVGGIPEMVDSSCGQLVEARDEQALAQALMAMMDAPERYSVDTIRERGRAYTFETVGKNLVDLYHQLTQK